ncbi:MAG: hypothetical protein M0Z75_08620 [Nitrospiraceae bacterium]|nr:hypothetical protein [Nitrospiraceae bacterium]
MVSTTPYGDHVLDKMAGVKPTTYKVTDPTSGISLKLEGYNPPSLNVIDAAFAKAKIAYDKAIKVAGKDKTLATSYEAIKAGKDITDLAYDEAIQAGGVGINGYMLEKITIPSHYTWDFKMLTFFIVIFSAVYFFVMEILKRAFYYIVLGKAFPAKE